MRPLRGAGFDRAESGGVASLRPPSNFKRPLWGEEALFGVALAVPCAALRGELGDRLGRAALKAVRLVFMDAAGLGGFIDDRGEFGRGGDGRGLDAGLDGGAEGLDLSLDRADDAAGFLWGGAGLGGGGWGGGWVWAGEGGWLG